MITLVSIDDEVLATYAERAHRVQVLRRATGLQVVVDGEDVPHQRADLAAWLAFIGWVERLSEARVAKGRSWQVMP